MIGEVIGSYRIVSELGRGGMGILYRVEHVQLGRPAALKMLLPALARDPELVQRFFHEAKAAAAIDHPGIVEIYDFGTHADGSAYIVMELLTGETLLARLRRGPIPPAEGAALIAQVAGALAAAHAQRIVHRDLKPDNIFLTPNDAIPGGVQVKLLDFGIAKLQAPDGGDGGGTFRTQTGQLIGTPAYMSPEQCMGKADLDHRTDLYSLGCILFHVLCGRPPFLSEHGSGVLIAAQLRDPPPPPRSLAPTLAPALEAIVLRLLEKEPDARYASAVEVKAALIAAGAEAPSTALLAAQLGAAPTERQVAPGPTSTSSTSSAAAGATPTTTRSGAAGEVATPTPADGAAAARPAGPARWLMIGGAAVAIAGVAAFLVVRATRDDDGGRAAAPPSDAAVVAVTIDAAPLATATIDAAPAVAVPVDATPLATATIDAAPVVTAPVDAGSPGADATVSSALTPDADGGAAPLPDAAAAPGITPASEPRLTLAAATVAAGAAVDVAFAAPLHAAPGEQFWITIVAAGAPDTTWGAYRYIDDGAQAIQLTAPTAPGAYEVRLHGNYPTRTTNVVARAAIQVQ